MEICFLIVLLTIYTLPLVFSSFLFFTFLSFFFFSFLARVSEFLNKITGSADGFMYSTCAKWNDSMVRPISLGIELQPSNSKFELFVSFFFVLCFVLGIWFSRILTTKQHSPGFLLPPNKIQPSIDEVWPAITYFIQQILVTNLSYPSSKDDKCVCDSMSNECEPGLLFDEVVDPSPGRGEQAFVRDLTDVIAIGSVCLVIFFLVKAFWDGRFAVEVIGDDERDDSRGHEEREEGGGEGSEEEVEMASNCE